MSSTKELIIIGYWQSEYEPEFPHPKNFIDTDWGPEIKNKIITYLKSAPLLPFTAKGESWCRFHCGKEFNGSREHTDGKYVWPEGLAHYLEEHQVRLPSEVIEYMCTHPIPALDFNPSKTRFNYDWWISQKSIS